VNRDGTAAGVGMLAARSSFVSDVELGNSVPAPATFCFDERLLASFSNYLAGAPCKSAALLSHTSLDAVPKDICKQIFYDLHSPAHSELMSCLPTLHLPSPAYEVGDD